MPRPTVRGSRHRLSRRRCTRRSHCSPSPDRAGSAPRPPFTGSSARCLVSPPDARLAWCQRLAAARATQVRRARTVSLKHRANVAALQYGPSGSVLLPLPGPTYRAVRSAAEPVPQRPPRGREPGAGRRRRSQSPAGGTRTLIDADDGPHIPHRCCPRCTVRRPQPPRISSLHTGRIGKRDLRRMNRTRAGPRSGPIWPSQGPISKWFRPKSIQGNYKRPGHGLHDLVFDGAAFGIRTRDLRITRP
jgi:hypothetical protein